MNPSKTQSGSQRCLWCTAAPVRIFHVAPAIAACVTLGVLCAPCACLGQQGPICSFAGKVTLVWAYASPIQESLSAWFAKHRNFATVCRGAQAPSSHIFHVLHMLASSICCCQFTAFMDTVYTTHHACAAAVTHLKRQKLFKKTMSLTADSSALLLQVIGSCKCLICSCSGSSAWQCFFNEHML